MTQPFTRDREEIVPAQAADAPRAEGSGSFVAGQVVTPVEGLVGVQTADGEMLALETLGPCIVERVDEAQGVLVHWLDAHTNSWLDPADICSPGEHAHLVAFYQCDSRGNRTLTRRRVDTHSGLDHNWVIELLPGDIVRSVRDDGAAWTFEWFYIFHRLHPKNTLWAPPPDDADAEALAAAELFFS